ncbi:histidine phosphatase family protein [Paenibacillus taichungensis]|uniref:Histidine phosphatase family protein n=1 Tax=Paenibacillus taichungensis TaxID=484184 RepID=A0ABX2MWG9_9BACL|nr:histidine phosphatase family protein [Paenibacillus taichungensis]NUU58411.1 histidine phosphatase family protein [Paenibacillus taichungensis]
MEIEAGHGGMQSREIILIRHGTTAWNLEKRYLGHTDIGLLPEAKQELSSLREQFSNITCDALYCSDLLRCQQTFTYIASPQTGQAKLDARLREIYFGQWEGLTYDQLKDNPQYRDWIDAPQEVTPPSGEPWTAFTARIDSFLKESLMSFSPILHSRSLNVPKVAVITHGGVIRYMVSRLIPNQDFWDTQVVPGQAIKIRLDGEGDSWFGTRLTFP